MKFCINIHTKNRSILQSEVGTCCYKSKKVRRQRWRPSPTWVPVQQTHIDREAKAADVQGITVSLSLSPPTFPPRHTAEALSVSLSFQHSVTIYWLTWSIAVILTTCLKNVEIFMPSIFFINLLQNQNNEFTTATIFVCSLACLHSNYYSDMYCSLIYFLYSVPESTGTLYAFIPNYAKRNKNR